MKYVTVGEAAIAWNVTERRVRLLCQSGRIDGARRNGWAWLIPEQAKPSDARSLRHLKNRSLQTGSQDFRELDDLKRAAWLTSAIDDQAVLNLASFALHAEGLPVSLDDMASVSRGELVQGFTLFQHIQVLNVIEAFKWAAGALDYSLRPAEHQLAVARELLAHHRIATPRQAYRTVATTLGSDFPPPKDELSIDKRIHILFSQYEGEWKWLHPVASAAFLLVELVRIAPFEHDNISIALLMAVMHLVQASYPLPAFRIGQEQELLEAVTKSFRRGDCRTVAAMLIDALMAALHRTEQKPLQEHP